MLSLIWGLLYKRGRLLLKRTKTEPVAQRPTVLLCLLFFAGYGALGEGGACLSTGKLLICSNLLTNRFNYNALIIFCTAP